MFGPLDLWRTLRRGWMLYHLGDERFRFMWDAPPAGEFVVLDCETTGLDVHKDEIIAIGAVRIVGDRLLTSERLELLIKPQRALDPEAVRIHGLRERDLAQGLGADEALHRLMHFVGSRPLVGYYLEFDLAMINRALFPMLGMGLPQARHEVSSMFHDWKFRALPPYQQQGQVRIDLRFETLMRELELPMRHAHNALNDAVMAGMAFIKLRHLLAGPG